jgi:hypothetical protein
MTPFGKVSDRAAPAPAGAARGLLRCVCTSNPFYVLSAGLFLVGLRASFGPSDGEVDAWALMSGLGGYTLLLAVTACLLVRFGNVWDDVRTVLLLVVLMFLATSVTFDEALVLNPSRGLLYSVVGLLFAITLSEGLLRATRLKLPAGFRLPYHLILALFFLYPPALGPLLSRPHSEEVLWGLFGFSSAAGLVFLTLLPAVRRGPDYVRDNGSPWRWPLYPWALFGLLALAVPARAFLLCWSMHLLDAGDRESLVFGPYFLIPFGFALGVLLLEVGLVSARRVVLGIALAVPAGLVVLALIGHQPDPVYQGFLDVFRRRLGGDPLYLTLLASAAFYVYAAVRRVSPAVEALTAVLAALAFVGPDTLTTGGLSTPRPWPLLAAAALQLALGAWKRESWRCLAGSVGLGVAATLALSAELPGSPLVPASAFHLALLAVLIVGTVFDDALARLLRLASVVLVGGVCVVVMFVEHPTLANAPQWVVKTYPPVMAVLLAGYGWALSHRVSRYGAALILVGWLAAVGWGGYQGLRQAVAGLDQILLSLATLGLAVLVSLAKSGQLSRWMARRRLAVSTPDGLSDGPIIHHRGEDGPGMGSEEKN